MSGFRQGQFVLPWRSQVKHHSAFQKQGRHPSVGRYHQTGHLLLERRPHVDQTSDVWKRPSRQGCAENETARNVSQEMNRRILGRLQAFLQETMQLPCRSVNAEGLPKARQKNIAACMSVEVSLQERLLGRRRGDSRQDDQSLSAHVPSRRRISAARVLRTSRTLRWTLSDGHFKTYTVSCVDCGHSGGHRPSIMVASTTERSAVSGSCQAGVQPEGGDFSNVKRKRENRASARCVSPRNSPSVTEPIPARRRVRDFADISQGMGLLPSQKVVLSWSVRGFVKSR